MSTPVRVGAFVLALAVLFGAAFGIGRLFEDEPERYSLRAQLEYGDSLLLLTISDGDGDTVLGYETRHEKQLHLIAVRKDFGGYHHLHPVLDNSGGWVLEEPGLEPGDWRLYADFQPSGGDPALAQVDLVVPGAVDGPGKAGVSTTASVDGYEVELGGADSLVPGQDSAVNFLVSRNGKDVTDLEPYLGANGHLVAIREADLRYLHVHPDPGALGAGPDIPFVVGVHDAGRYRLYLEFKHRGVVRTAAFVVEARTGDQIHDTNEMDHGDH